MGIEKLRSESIAVAPKELTKKMVDRILHTIPGDEREVFYVPPSSRFRKTETKDRKD